MNMEIYHFSLETLFYWIVAFSIYEWVAIAVILAFSHKRFDTPIEYYRMLPSWVAVFGDFIYSTAILLTAQLVFKFLEQKGVAKTSKLLLFILLVVIIQWIYDMIFAYFVMSMPSSFSKYVSFFKRYIKEAGFGAAISDSIWIVGWVLLTIILLKYIPVDVACLILSISLFIWLVVKW